MAEPTTMGALASLVCEDEEDRVSFQELLSAVDRNFPGTWRSWAVHNYSFNELFGAEITQQIDAKLRFAIPLTDIARAFNPSTSSLSERRFRIIKTKMLRWPLGRALLYAPHSIMEKIHAPDYTSFMNAVRELKPKLVNRHRASALLQDSSQVPESDVSIQSGSMAREKRSSISNAIDVESPPKRLKQTQASDDNMLAEVLNKQMEMFNKLFQVSVEQNENIKKLINRDNSTNRSLPNEEIGQDLNESFESVPDSTCTDQEVEEEVASCSSAAKSVSSSYREQILRDQIAEAQRKLVALQNGEDVGENSFDFNPFTVEKEPKVAKSDEVLLKQGINCQRFGQEGWRNVRYADTQKMFQATPAFSSLKPNNILPGVTPTYKSAAILEKFDMTLGAVTYGLLQQRRNFKELLDKMPKDVRNQVGRDFLDANSNFKKVSDNLLQYVCGRRAEVIQQRREMYRPANRVLRQILHPKQQIFVV